MSSMGAMADDVSADGLWNWSAAAPLEPARIRAAIAGVLHRPMVALGEWDPGDAVLCDVWQVGGDFPTLIDCYLAPGNAPEEAVAGAVAVRLGVDLLLPDDSL